MASNNSLTFQICEVQILQITEHKTLSVAFVKSQTFERRVGESTNYKAILTFIFISLSETFYKHISEKRII